MMSTCIELYRKRYTAALEPSFVAGDGLDGVYGKEYGFSLAGDLHNPSLPVNEIERYVNSEVAVLRFLIVGNSSLTDSQREHLKTDPVPVVAAAASYLDPEVQDYPREWLEQFSGAKQDVFADINWLNSSSDFDSIWYDSFMKERYPTLYASGLRYLGSLH